MHNNYYFLLQLCKELKEVFTDAVLAECYSQDKDELVLHFVKAKKSLFIKADLNPLTSCLSFPSSLSRAKRNSVDLFKELIGAKVNFIKIFENERCFSFVFDGAKELLFKLYGHRSNILLFSDDVCIALFRNKLAEDAEIKTDDLPKTLDWSKEAFVRNRERLKKHYFTFGRLVWNYLDSQSFTSKNMEEQWLMLVDLKNQLESPELFFITRDQQSIKLSFFSEGDIIKSSNSAVEAINTFYQELSYQSSTQDIKNKALNKLQSRIKAAENYIEKTKLKAEALQSGSSYKHKADLIMANLQNIAKGADEITLEDFYAEGKHIKIKLKPDQSAQKNAEVFYRKAKNQQIQIDKLSESIENKGNEIKQLQKAMHELSDAVDLKSVRQIIVRYKIDTTTQSEKIILPYHEIVYNNYKILIGKNASSNDELTLRHTYKEDLWLHAKDVAGSHVVIKYQSGKNFPKDVIERAAQLAAYHSKRKTESLCPVVYTPKKFVRKRKGSLPGEVIVEREEVIMVVPLPI